MDYRVVLLSKTLHEQLLWDSRIPSESRTIAKPVLKREINNVDAFSFTVYKTHPLYDKLTPYNGWVAVKKNGKVKFIGKITQAPDNIRHEKNVQCEGGLALLKHSAYSRYMPNWCPKAYDKSVSKFSVTDSVEKMVNRVLDIHNAQVYEGAAEKWEDSFPCIRLGTCTARENPYGVDLVKSAGNEGTQNEGLYITRDQTSCTTPYDWLTSEVCEKCAAYAIMEVGGDYSLTLNIYGAKELPANTTTPIRFEKNLLDMSLDVDFSDVCTVFLPLGESNSNVGTLLGSKTEVSFKSEGQSVIGNLSFGGIIEKVFGGDITEDIEDIVNDSIEASTTDVSTETVYNTMAEDGSIGEALKDAALTYEETEAYKNRTGNMDLVMADDGGAVLLTYYKWGHPEPSHGGEKVITESVTYYICTTIGYIDLSDQGDILIRSSNNTQETLKAVSRPTVYRITNAYAGRLDFTTYQGTFAEDDQIATFNANTSNIEIWAQKYFNRNNAWTCVRAWNRTAYTDTPVGSVHNYKATINTYSQPDVNAVFGIVSDYKNITEADDSTETYTDEISINSYKEDRYLFGGLLQGKNDKKLHPRGGANAYYYFALNNSGSWGTYTFNGSYDEKLVNYFVTLPKRTSLTVITRRIDSNDSFENHVGFMDIGDSGLGWVETVDNTGTFTNASVDGVTIRANYPYLEWVEGIEKYGRIVKTHTWSSARRSQLRQYAPVYFRQKILEAETINANAVDIGLSDIETGMSYKVICEQMGKKQWYPCLKSEENLMDPTKNKFTFTYKHPTFTQEVMKIAKNVSSANRRLPATVLKSVGGVALSENPQ